MRDVVRFDGAGTADASVLLSLVGRSGSTSSEGEIEAVLVSNRGGDIAGAALSDNVVALLSRWSARSDLEIQPSKADAIEDADAAGNAFMSFFTTFGTFSIAAGILLIFLIFVMLAAERRGELGIARAVGTRRGHLVQMFTFEGVAYDVLAAPSGRSSERSSPSAWCSVMANAFGAADADEGLQIEFAVAGAASPSPLLSGCSSRCVVVAASAWRVSVMTSRPRSGACPSLRPVGVAGGSCSQESRSCSARR